MGGGEVVCLKPLPHSPPPALTLPHMQDEQMAQERRGHQAEGGCCALVVVYLLGKVYVANAGDSRYGEEVCENAYRGSHSLRWGRRRE